MADPKKYQRGYSFSDYQANNPKNPLPGPKVDSELENIAQSVGQAIDAIKDVRRSDGKLKNGVVTLDSLAPEVSAGVGDGALAARDEAVAAAEAAAASAITAETAAETAAGAAGTAQTSAGQALGYRDAAEAAAASADESAQIALGAATGALPDGSVTNVKMAAMPAKTLKGTDTAGSPKDLTPAQVVAGFFPSGSVINSVSAVYTANATLSAVIPLDDTIPQSNEGTQILSAVITPSAASSILEVEVIGWGATVVANDVITAALFRDDDGGAFHATQASFAANTDVTKGFSAITRISAGTTAPVMIKARVGGAVGAIRLNGITSARRYGGAAATTLVVREIKA